MDQEVESPMLNNNCCGENGKMEVKRQYIATVAVCLGAVCAGTVLAWTSPVLAELVPNEEENSTIANTTNVNMTNSNDTNTTKSFQLTSSEGGIVGSMLAIGALFAALPAGCVAEKFGRKKAILWFIVPFYLNWILIIFANGATMLYVARFFAGVGTGAMCVLAPMYISEIGEASIRGTLGSYFQMFMCAGILLTCILGAFTNWIQLSIILAVLPVVFMGCFYFMPETPVFQIKTGSIDSAESTLRYFRGNLYDVSKELKAIQMDVEEAQGKSGGIKDLIGSKVNRKALIAALGAMIFQQLSGINAVIFYTVPIFKSAGSSLAPSVAAIIVALVQVVISYVACLIIDKANRKVYLSISSIGMLICLAALGMYFHLQKLQITSAGLGILPLASCVLFMVCFALGYGPIPWMLMGELFAPEIKGIASGLAVMTNWLLVFTVTFSFPILNASLGGHVTFYLFSIIMGVATVFVYFLVPETRGKTLKEIQSALSK